MVTHEPPKKALNAALGITGAMIGAVLAVAGLGTAFGGYREKIDANVQDIRELKGETNQRLDRIETKVDTLTNVIMQQNSNRRR